MELLGTLAAAPKLARAQLMELRNLVLGATDLSLEETTRWGQHSFIPPRKFGTAGRLHWTPAAPDRAEMLVHCGTDVVARWRDLYGSRFAFDGKRAVHIPLVAPFASDAIAHMAAVALCYRIPSPVSEG